eukprot:1161681-Pelagomonas_calceolata.AAC.21
MDQIDFTKGLKRSKAHTQTKTTCFAPTGGLSTFRLCLQCCGERQPGPVAPSAVNMCLTFNRLNNFNHNHVHVAFTPGRLLSPATLSINETYEHECWAWAAAVPPPTQFTNNAYKSTKAASTQQGHKGWAWAAALPHHTHLPIMHIKAQGLRSHSCSSPTHFHPMVHTRAQGLRLNGSSPVPRSQSMMDARP